MCIFLQNGDDASDKTTCVLKSKQMLKSVMKSFSTCNKEMGMMNKTAQEYHDSLGVGFLNKDYKIWRQCGLIFNIPLI